MARPQKKGLSYFNIDCNMDSSIDYIEAVHGIIGYAVVLKLWQAIYGEEGYYMEWNKRQKFLFCNKNNLELQDVEQVLQTCFEEGIFSQEKFDEYGILTSKGVQKRYMKICKDAKRKNFEILEKYEITPQKELTPEETPEIREETPEIREESTQSKVKKRKVKKSKEEESKVNQRKEFQLFGWKKDFQEIFLSEFPDYAWTQQDTDSLDSIYHYFKKIETEKIKKVGVGGVRDEELARYFEVFVRKLPDWERENNLSLKSLANGIQRICNKIKSEAEKPQASESNSGLSQAYKDSLIRELMNTETT